MLRGLRGQRRVGPEGGLQGRAAQRVRDNVRAGAHGGRARLPADDRHLAHTCALAEGCEGYVASAAGCRDHIYASPRQHDRLVSRFPLPEQHAAGRVASLYGLGR
jgi:hypothetical protein